MTRHGSRLIPEQQTDRISCKITYIVTDVITSLDSICIINQQPYQPGKNGIFIYFITSVSHFWTFYVDTPSFVNIVCTSMAMILSD